MANIQIHCTKDSTVTEYASLMASVGWGTTDDYDEIKVSHSIDSYPFVAHARTDDGTLVGSSVPSPTEPSRPSIGKVLVHPRFQGLGVGSILLEAVEARYRRVPVYAKPFQDQEQFFLRNGYQAVARPRSVVFKRNEVVG